MGKLEKRVAHSLQPSDKSRRAERLWILSTSNERLSETMQCINHSLGLASLISGAKVGHCVCN